MYNFTFYSVISINLGSIFLVGRFEIKEALEA